VHIPFSESDDKSFHEWIQQIPGITASISYYSEENGDKSYKEESKTDQLNTSTPKLQMAETLLKVLEPNAVHENTNSELLHLVKPPPISAEIKVTSPAINENRVEDCQQQAKGNAVTIASANQGKKIVSLERFTRILECKQCCAFQGSPDIYSCTLLGDQNFLNLAAYKMDYQTSFIENKRIRTCGYCISGLTIRKATEVIREIDAETHQSLLVNVGSVDIAEGRQLIEMIHDMIEFLRLCDNKKIDVILTTLPPIPNYLLGNKRHNLNGFNHFLRVKVSNHCPVIDLNVSMCRKDGTSQPNFYQPEPRHISGTTKPFVLWNKLGQNRVFEMIMKNLGLAHVYQDGLFKSFD
jgi:hypothetical protein